MSSYVNALIGMDVWIKPPDGLAIPAGMGCCIKKESYGTKQAGRCWWEQLSTKMQALGFKKSMFNTSVYFSLDNDTITWMHVDNGIVVAQDKAALKILKEGLKRDFMIKWKLGVNNMVGIEIRQQEEGFTLTQQKLIDNIVVANRDGKRLNDTPFPSKCNVSTTPADETIVEQKLFLLVIGGLSYIANGTRPDISFSVNM
ncbi:hypothetical protein O181_000806 [Austropuccinia psidii MF-1]|uniref:Reverse transcriptase Ty1/copia-type domain-containing protein n=1 Tax=Austropuccinia psidii MF-1 TaxID=1389203 RepID=A0A9Q3B9S1_9BASI|nr:hypothetical protein [Austropuccinia psidii MF-1]